MEELRTHGHQDQIPMSGKGEEGDVHSSHHHPPEKIKSVLKKVKDKAKKIKNTLTKHGHDDDHDMGRKEGDSDDESDHEFEKQGPPVSSVVEGDPNSPKSNLLPSNHQPKDSTEMGVGREGGITSMDNQTKSPDLLTNQKPNKEVAPSYLDKAIAAASKLGESGEKKFAILMSGKMSPGEEDKALSETISNALEWRKKGDQEEEEGGMKKKKVMGEVKVSDELAKRLGGTSIDDGRSKSVEEVEEEGRLPGVSESMVEKIKETVGSWFGVRAGDPSQASSVGTSTTTIGGSGNVQETKGATNS